MIPFVYTLFYKHYLTMKKFSPLVFLASLGAGGISVIPFSFLNYTFAHPKGLVNYSHIPHGDLSMLQEIFFRFLESIMVVFPIIHIVLSLIFLFQLISWLRGPNYSSFISDPLKNSAILAPFISLAMTMNVLIGPVRFFIPAVYSNLQSFMLPALILWLIIGFFLMKMELKLLKTSFVKSFDVSKINFGWLLHSFALAMFTVTGTGIAALSTSPNIAHIAAFTSFVFGGMGIFLLFVKMFTLFKSHFEAPGLPEKQFLPSFLIVIPNITLYAISFFRIGHYLEHNFGAHFQAYFMLIVTIAFAFETWYMLFGLSLLKNYFKNDFFKEFHVSQWGLVCPLVAYAVLGSFVYNTFVQSSLFYYGILIVMLITIVLFFSLLIKHMRCGGLIKKNLISCD